MKWMYVVCLLSVTGSFACASDSNTPDAPSDPAEVMLGPFECTPLVGTYRVVYAKRSGDCADLQEQLAHFSDRPSTSALSDDCQGTVTTSEDDCDREEDSVCSIISEQDGSFLGTAKLVTAFTQTSEMRIEGMATIELDSCSATYSLIGSKIE